MSIGLDLGSNQFRSIRTATDKLVARSCSAMFTALADSSGHRRLLQQSETQFATCADHLLIFGDAAKEWSTMLNLSATPLLREGRLPTSDPLSRQVLTVMMDALLPIPETPGEVCCLTIPGGGSRERNRSQDTGLFLQLVSLRGYQPQMISATRALVLAELHRERFTGIGLTIGHATCEFGLVHCGQEIARHIVMNGLESFENSPAFGDSDAIPMSAAAGRSYARFFAEVIAEARSQFERDDTLRTLAQPLPVICTGAITRQPSFRSFFQQIWNESGWPVTTRPIQIASDAPFSVARGCLIQAVLEQPSQRQVA